MAAPKISAMPWDVEMGGGFTIRLDAIDPTTGNTVAGVIVSNIAIGAADLGSSGAALTAFTLIDPVLLHKA